MRAIFVTSLGAACAVALALPLALPAGAAAARPAPSSPPDRAVPGTTRSLPVERLGAAAGNTSDRAAAAAGLRGLSARKVQPFSLLGVVWDDGRAELRGQVQVRTRTTGTDIWSGWQEVQAHNDDAPDLDAAERRGSRARGSTAPLWVGDSDAVQLRITPETVDRAPATLPGGLRLELVDPGDEPETARGVHAGPPAPLAPATPEAAASSAVNAQLAPLGATEIPALDKAASRNDVNAADGSPAGAHPYIGPRPRMVTRAGWGADESLREKAFAYTSTVRAAFVHHSASGNNYTCAQAPSVLRAIYRYHVKTSGWRDMGYNFLVDKCGTIYEGRAGGVAKPVMGAHTLGFNHDSMGVAVLGTFTTIEPPQPAVDAIAALTAWKLGLYGADPQDIARLKSSGGNRFKKGVEAKLHVISGHRDGFNTQCPGDRLYDKLGATRIAAAQLQGR
ncbi:peptidoglycan recognition protein [Streptomyces sp. NPDC048248]|uniref:peptidoglycan recognition protein family protein n=1 Tax=Streptomyces sp. NPDC048248 TaxID=3365523 RepID=UPI0037106C13